MSTLRERMQHVIDQGWVKSARQWSIDAGLTPQHVTTYLERASRDDSADMERNKVVRLAEAAHVSPGWLAAEEGAPRGGAVAELIIERYVAARVREVRRKVPAMHEAARALGVDVGTVRHVWGGGRLGSDRQKTWARALGFMSDIELRSAASEWWRLVGQRVHAIVQPANDSNQARADANAIARSWGATDQDILTVLEDLDGIEGETLDFWTQKFMAAAQHRIDSDQYEEKVRQPKRKKLQAAVRDKHEERKRPPKAPKSTRNTGTG